MEDVLQYVVLNNLDFTLTYNVQEKKWFWWLFTWVEEPEQDFTLHHYRKYIGQGNGDLQDIILEIQRTIHEHSIRRQ